MNKITMTKGLPGSGKTTWARKELETDKTAVLLCKDDLRAMMFNSAWTGNREKFILKTRDSIISQALKDGRNVIVHDTNLHPKHEVRLMQLADEHKALFEIKDFTWIPIEECIENDLRREDSVGERVIRKMYEQFLKPEPQVVVHDPKLPNAIICDLDGTLALFGKENPYDRDFTKDKLNLVISDLLYQYMSANHDPMIIIVSGRKDKYKDQTVAWLENNAIAYDHLFMRPTQRDGIQEPKDVIVKTSIYNRYIKDRFNVLFVLDDRDQVVEMWRGMGLTCLQVAPGDF